MAGTSLKDYRDVRTVAFMFIQPLLECEEDGYQEMHMDLNGKMRFILIGVKDFATAKAQARRLYEGGLVMLELCAGFGHLMTADICKTVESKIPVGVIYIDNHGGYNGESGDVRWMGANDFSKTFSISPCPENTPKLVDYSKIW